MNFMAIFAKINAWMNATYMMLTEEDVLFMAMNNLS